MISVKRKLIVKNKQGLHARPAALFVQIANKFDADVTVTKDDVEVNGKSIMGILTLAAEKDSIITIIAYGKDANEAMVELEKIVTVEEIQPRHRQSAHPPGYLPAGQAGKAQVKHTGEGKVKG